MAIRIVEQYQPKEIKRSRIRDRDQETHTGVRRDLLLLLLLLLEALYKPSGLSFDFS
ncbi:hypothetical protein AXF42_Ash016664 [Apostasia shenzhenica]|uniref:Uncharacterized protein n=1 Tax=Apostasia shenzhenica TaxID=1088818 RepID=A0A2I0A1R1_9ASPA|nr:hypothetical protein AXF42_Ash016664 [Apostasia shenzhenica]